MIVDIQRTGSAVVLIAEGHVDSATAPEFQSAICAAIESTDQMVILDLEKVPFMSSAGLRTVLMVSKDLQKRNARVAVCSPQQMVRDVFTISGFERIIGIYNTQHDALASVD